MAYRLNHERMPIQTAHRNVVQLIYFALQLEALRTKLKEVIPIGRNFEIHFCPENSLLSLRNTENNRILPLNSFLPSGYTFLQGDEFFVDENQKIVSFSQKDLPFRTFLMSLFHEIGHLKISSTQTKNDGDQTFLDQGVQNLGSWLSHAHTRILNTNSLGDPSLPTPLALEFINEYQRENAKVERQARALGLVELRKLQNDGWNVFAGFGSIQELRDTIDASLYTYEIDQSLRILEEVDSESAQSIQAEFVKNKKRFQEKFFDVFQS